MNTLILNPPPALEADQAILLDFDGTLVDIADSPDEIELRPSTLPLLRELLNQLDGAVAIISGRAISELQHYLPIDALTLVGAHGAQWHLPGRPELYIADVEPVPGKLLDELRQRLSNCPHVLIEHKQYAIAVHYRRAPEHEDSVRLATAELGKKHALDIVQGKAVIELRIRGIDKGKALEKIMASEAFMGRQPVMFGDDYGDEAAFSAAARLGGWGVRLGNDRTTAAYRLRSPAHWHEWMTQQLAELAHNRKLRTASS